MRQSLSPADAAKRAAAYRATQMVEDGMRLGLGTGSTAAWMLRCLARRIEDEGLRVTGVPTSKRTEDAARALGIPLASLEEVRWLDLAIDGADEIDGDLQLIKGAGGALLREKIVAAASDTVVIIAEHAKRVGTLGAFPLPVEIVPFGSTTTRALIEELLVGLDVTGDRVEPRRDGEALVRTDEGNLILDLHLERIGDPRHLSLTLNQVPGVVENGLFLDLCDIVVTGHANGRIEMTEAAGGPSVDGTSGAARNLFGDLAE